MCPQWRSKLNLAILCDATTSQSALWTIGKRFLPRFRPKTDIFDEGSKWLLRVGSSLMQEAAVRLLDAATVSNPPARQGESSRWLTRHVKEWLALCLSVLRRSCQPIDPRHCVPENAALSPPLASDVKRLKAFRPLPNEYEPLSTGKLLSSMQQFAPKASMHVIFYCRERLRVFKQHRPRRLPRILQATSCVEMKRVREQNSAASYSRPVNSLSPTCERADSTNRRTEGALSRCR